MCLVVEVLLGLNMVGFGFQMGGIPSSATISHEPYDNRRTCKFYTRQRQISGLPAWWLRGDSPSILLKFPWMVEKSLCERDPRIMNIVKCWRERIGGNNLRMLKSTDTGGAADWAAKAGEPHKLTNLVHTITPQNFPPSDITPRFLQVPDSLQSGLPTEPIATCFAGARVKIRTWGRASESELPTPAPMIWNAGITLVTAFVLSMEFIWENRKPEFYLVGAVLYLKSAPSGDNIV